MSTTTMSTQAYIGSLLAVNFLSSQQTLLLSAFGGTSTQTIVNNDNKFFVDETVQVGGSDFTVVGSGWVQPGISILGLVVPTGTRVDAILVRSVSTGQLRLLYPEGPPWATGMIALVVDIDPVAYNLNTFGPLCFTATTRLAAAGGLWRPAAEIEPGEDLLDRNGYRVRVLARISLDMNGPFSPLSETIQLPDGAGLSRQHRIVLSGPIVETHFGRRSVLAPAIALAETGHARRVAARPLGYVHLLTERHSVLVAEGCLAESLLLGPQARQRIEGVAEVEEGTLSSLETRFPGVARRSTLPVVNRREAVMLLRAGAVVAARGHPEAGASRRRAA